jgi:hypothetical protein
MTTQPEANQVPLMELLAAVPPDIRIGVDDGNDWKAGTTWHPVGQLCHEAAAELRRLNNLCAEWEKKAATWLASPESAKRLDGYRELAQRVNTLEAALRQAVEALEKAMGDSAEFGRISYGECLSAISTAKQALGKPDAP